MIIAVILVVIGIMFIFLDKLPIILQILLALFMGGNGIYNIMNKGNYTSGILNIIIVICVVYIIYDKRKFKI